MRYLLTILIIQDSFHRFLFFLQKSTDAGLLHQLIPHSPLIDLKRKEYTNILAMVGPQIVGYRLTTPRNSILSFAAGSPSTTCGPPNCPCTKLVTYCLILSALVKLEFCT